MDFTAFLNSIPKIKNIPLPAELSQLKMSPPFREALQEQQKDAIKTARKAAVLALFYPDSTKMTRLVLILRKTYRGVHSAQVGFPGGKLEEFDESMESAALRETEEEVGVSRHYVDVLRGLTQVYIPPSNFFVYPFIGYTKKTPVFSKQDEEVEEIIHVTLADFLNPKNVINKKVTTSYKKDVVVPAFKLNGYVVWGATAMMLSEIKDLLNEVL
ncbi:NUDIX hydrolase [Mangrovimonas cancribranchiae]|uniref:CoA pyrophosphatase n=1 Tax=Mangrovimonas cancribranchiae TaxID=3080055 RepID=A0AAU6NYC6_9FLAO